MTKLANGDGSVLYFAYGSMVNPVSKKRRGINPTYSSAARLDGYKLVWNAGPMGMGNIEEEAGACMHGVVHQVPAAEWDALCNMEAGYNVIQVPVTPYTIMAGGPQDLPRMTAHAFLMPATHIREGKLPTERYIDIIVRGLQHYQVDPAFIAQVAATPCVPRRKPSEYATAPLAAPWDQLPLWEPQQLTQHMHQQGDDGSVLFSIRDKVLRINPPEHLRQEHVMVMAHKFYSGRDVCLGLTLGLYEPQLPEATGAADLTPQHAAWAEDHVMHGLDEAGIPVAVVARLTACIDEFVMG